ncbi:DNA-directed RNA polymerase I complex subunit Rpa2 p [Tribonema minus]|uniref:DNA-directed RNA polymerase subunit beta n=1 Tax=Tribonema minus TaxID=303371 RepID=A0A835YVF9_9STRA|nr:DNA-directed RNA polymerase I complex subunit Rpa2 p [Tribonema minus]
MPDSAERPKKKHSSSSSKSTASAKKSKPKPSVPRTGPSYDISNLPSAATAEKMQSLVDAHVNSFNQFLDEGLNDAVLDLPDVELRVGEDGPLMRLWYESVELGYPGRSRDETSGAKLVPRECRERNLTYGAPIHVNIAYQLEGSEAQRVQRRLGECPIMVRSKRCHLAGLGPKEMVALKEEDTEIGGYFIVGGLERVIRLLQVPRRNHAQAIRRSAFKNRGQVYSDLGVSMRCDHSPLQLGQVYSDLGVSMRCGRRDHSTATVTLHYLTTGGATLRWSVRRAEFLVPVMVVIKALREISDRELYERVLAGDTANTQLAARLEVLLLDAARVGLHTREQCLAFLGSRFRAVGNRTDVHSDLALGIEIINRHVLVHLKRHEDKQETLLHMLKKPGHLFTMYMKEKLFDVLVKVRSELLKQSRIDVAKALLAAQDPKTIIKLVDRYGIGTGQRMASFLSTGNITTSTGLDLMQASGFTVVAERINMLRYLSHFRSVHRGQFFTTMKTTAVRKLLPESWGFLCPVHTPDGAPCGLLNHMAAECQILVSLGMTPAGIGSGDGSTALPYYYMPVMVDGRVVGGGTHETLQAVSRGLRRLKVATPPAVEPTMEVALLPPMKKGSGPFPGLFLFTGASRMIRPVLNIEFCKREWIGPLEQPFMEIACLASEAKGTGATHCEIDPTNMLSLIASLTPFSDYNQSPRNMYQCQMGKQTMGTPAHCLYPHKTDNKMYRILFPQAPLVMTRRHREFQMDNYPQGTNAVVAVISYTGFDMEDAMILNKSAFERGFAHASVVKTIKIDLKDLLTKSDSKTMVGKMRFTNTAADGKGGKLYENLDNDGLPRIGACVKEGDPLYCAIDLRTNKTKTGKHKESEMAYVETVRAVGGAGINKEAMAKASMTLRFPRNPIIGDKFSSRHGQKGVMSILWPQSDMPFTESGMTPDIIINPHAFPSRMTIGMLIESMAGKAGALHGHFQDATPFSFHEKNRVIDHFGEQLKSAGYAYYGSEPLYSGISGTVMHADIFIGLVYYQRLRHMVSDKSQVRASGAVNPLTRQPIKGRKNKGGIRFGEMERDSLLSHGAAFLLHDRLMNCSDRHLAHVCCTCGSMLSPCHQRSAVTSAGRSEEEVIQASRCRYICRALKTCQDKGQIESVAMPYVFRYLANELAGMGIKLTLTVK